ncbi:MAG: hypothetical protein U0Q16_00835 [Bryobacteraceae bacterium]
MRENTKTVPGIDVRPAFAIASNVTLPIKKVSNWRNISPKSKSGSCGIQSCSPFGPAMYPSRLAATEYRTRRILAS